MKVCASRHAIVPWTCCLCTILKNQGKGVGVLGCTHHEALFRQQ
jgi:hypothetical protein